MNNKENSGNDVDLGLHEILKGAVENTNEAFVTIDHDSRVVLFNRAAEEIFGYSREEVVGRDLGLILSPMCRERHEAAVRNYVKTGQGRMIGHETELAVARKSGEIFPATISFSVAQVEGRLFFTGILRDLTEKKAMEEKVAQAERLALLGRTVAEINHEIKNPLIMIGGFARQLLKKITGDREQAKLQLIVSEVERLERLLAGLKNLYRPRDLQLSVSDLPTLLREVILLARGESDKEGVAISLEAPAELLVEVDREKMKQVLLNLVKNSLEACAGTGGEISIRTVAEPDRVKIVIADTGPGIPEELQQRIFTPFFTTKESGSGLGLCISKRIVEDHPDSSLTLASRKGEGTAVTITLSRPGSGKKKSPSS